MRIFATILAAQVVSLVGTQIVGFGLGVWVFQRTGSTSLYGLVSAAVVLPRYLFAPLAGVWVDRFDRRKVLLIQNVSAGLCSAAMLFLHHSNALDVWWIVVLSALASLCSAGDRPTFAAMTTTLLPDGQLARANGLYELGAGLALIVGPAVAGNLMDRYGLGWILVVDVATFGFAAAILAYVRTPKFVRGSATASRRGGVFVEARDAWCHLRSRPDLIALLGLFSAYHFLAGLAVVLVTPLILGFADAQALGYVLALGGLGMLTGGGWVALWGGPRRPLNGVLGFMALSGAVLLLGAGYPSLPLASTAVFAFMFATPIVASCNQTIWQRSVEARLQGRVFGLREAIIATPIPIAYLLAGPLVDGVFEPWMTVDGPLRDSVGYVLGVGPGRGVALAFAASGGMILLLVVAMAVCLGRWFPDRSTGLRP